MDNKKVVIVGGGFAGLQAAKRLGGKGLDVTVLDRQNFHLFTPLLYQVATSSLEQEAIAQPLRSIFRSKRGLRYRRSEVTGLDLESRIVETDHGPFPYDYLILAAGSVTNFFGLDSVARHAFDLKYVVDAIALRNHVLSAFEEMLLTDDPARRKALLTFVVVGGGPTGVEFVGALAELVHLTIRKDFRTLSMDDVRVILVEAKDTLLPAYGGRLSAYARKRLERMGVEVMTETAVTEATPDQVVMDDGTVIEACTLVWSAGVQPEPMADALPGQRSRDRRVVVNDDLTLPGYPEVYIAGDMAYVEWKGKPLPAMAPVAQQQGAYAARAILARERGRTIKPFSFFDRGNMAVIGRGHAIANIRGLRLAGLPAWIAWLGLHFVTLIGFRNRLLVLGNWAFDYIFYDRKVRIISDTQHSHRVPEHRTG